MPKVDIPRVGIVEFPDTMSQEQILRAIETDIIPNYQRPEYGVIESGIKGLKRGASRMGSMITDTIPALIGSGLGYDEYAKRQLEEGAQKEAELQRTNPAQFTSYKQVEGLGDALRFGAETLGESATDILGIIGTGGVGGALGKRAAVKGAEQLAENIAKREAIRDVLPGGVSAARAAELEAAAVREAAPAIQKAQATGQAAGVYLGSYATNTPDVFQSIYENTNQLAPGASLLFGGAVAALDAVLPGQLLKSMTQTEKLSVAEKILERSGMKPSLLRKATATIPQTAAKEGLTEGAQEVITAMAEKFVDDHQDIWDSEHFNRYMESAVRGAVAGGPFGGVQAVGERMGERSRDRQIQQAQQAEEARVAAEQEAQAQIQAEQELARATGQGEQLPLFQPGELPKLPSQLEFPSTIKPAPVEEAIQPSGQMELFAPQTNPKTQPKPTLEADVRVLEKKLKEVEKQKIAEGKEADQAQKEAIAELAPKDIDLLNYAKRVGITSTPLYQLTQQAAEIQPRKGAKPIQQTPIKTWDTLAKGDVVTLYRGENKDNVQGGVWWTTDKNKAAKYGAVQEASVPVEFIGANAVRGHGGADEFVFVGQTPAALTETNIPPTASLLTADRLKETGLSPRAGIYKRLLDKDLVANADDIRAEIANAQNNPNISKNTITALQSLEAKLPTVEQVPEPVVPEEQAAPVPEPVVPEEQAAPVPEPVASQEQPAVEESPADIWEFMDTGVPYEELDAAKKTEWEQAVQTGTSNQPLADDLAISHLQSPTPQEPVDIGEREAAEFETPSVTEDLAIQEPPLKEGYVRVYHSGAKGDGKDGRWVSTDRKYAADYRPNQPLFYVDLPENDSRFEGAWPNQGVKQGFTFNFELTPAEAKRLVNIKRQTAEFEESSLKKAFSQVGEELSKLASSIGAKQNLIPEEEASLGKFMSALGNLMYELVKSGAKTFAQALPLAKRRARKELGDLAKYVPDTAYKTAYEQVAKAAEAKPISPAKQREENKNVFEKIANANVDNMPPMTQKLAGEVLNTASGLPRSLRRAWLGALSLYQMYQTYGGIIPSIKALDNALTVRDTDISKRQERVGQKVKALHAVFSKYTAAQKEKFFTIFQNTTLDQIDPLTVTVKETINSNGQVQRTRTYELKPSAANAANPLVKQFYAMPKDVQEAYMDLRRTYDESADEFEKLITKDVTPGTAAKLRTQFELRRIKVYLPLFRQGEYWLSYQDKAGEPVVMAFPSERERQLEVQRARSTGMKEIREFARFEDITSRTNGVPPVGFVSKIMETLKDEQVSPLVLDEVYSAYLSLFPAESIRQMARARKGIAGANKDAVEVYANIGSRLANQLGNLTHAKSIDEAVNNITQEANANGSIEARDVVLDIAERIKNVTAPPTNKLASDVSSAASSASYYMYIAGNASSAIINLTQLPIVVYSLLGGKYGFTDAFNAMSKATSMYLNGGKDDNSTFLPDRTFVTGKNVSAEHKALYEDAVKYGIIRRSTAHELVDLRKHTAGDYTGMGAKVRTTLGWMFQNSERANREITLLAAYDLARKKGASPEAARQEAMNLVTEAHGGALSSTGPRYFQGNVGRVVFTFKRFATSQLYLMGKLFNQAFRDSDEKVREIAQRQLFGIYLMAFTFAGAQGLPLYGALSLLAGMIMGDDDEPVDTDAIITEAIGDMAYKGPINQLLNIDIASRTGFNGMFWRDNPKRRSEVGTLTYLLEQAAGPSFSAAVNAQKAFGMISDGYVYRGFESMSPVAVKNVMKGMRYIAEGATNKDGVPIVQDVSLYNAFMQLGGFAPADLSEAYARAGAKKATEKALLERRTALLDLLHVAKQNGDTEGVREITERIQVFSQKNPEKPLRITSDTISRSERSHKQREREMVDGVHINKNLRRRLDDIYGTADEED